ncbi:hypothetical protein, partial [Salmonella enterica]|uniref:hypothetical protein n=1 Tax=Salmonella enterica TaxID=28901 RepID=UPI00352414CC
SDDYETSLRIQSWFNRNMGIIGTTFKVSLKDIYRGIYEAKYRPAAINDWPQAGLADELPPLQGQIQLNAAHQAELDR